MIKSKIDARERALEFVVPLAIELIKGGNSVNMVSMAEEMVEFLVGDAELPEVFDDNGHLKEFIEMAKKGMEDINKRNDDLFGDIIKTLPEDVIRDKGLVGIIPCNSEAK